MSETLHPVKNIYGNFWYRFLAYIIDFISLAIMSSVVMIPLVMYLFMDGSKIKTENIADSQLILGFVSYLINILYGTLFECSGWQGTIGKKVLNLKVTNLEGEALNFSEALIRNVAKFWINLVVLLLPLVTSLTPPLPDPNDQLAQLKGPYMMVAYVIYGVGLIGYLMAAFTERRQAIHDILAKTAVLKSKSKSASTDDEW